MATSGKGTATVGYNVQIAVDAEHHLIVAHEVTNQGYDRHQLAPMAFKARQATGCEQITALADRGYFNGDQVLSCEGTGVAPVVPKTLTSSGAKRGLFTRQDFIYDADKLDRMPDAMGVRRQTVEHPFGTLKAWMGATHFLTRTLDKVRTEMSLHVLAYNLKRMITIFGVGPLTAAIRT